MAAEAVPAGVEVAFEDASLQLECQRLDGRERLGEPSCFELQVFSDALIALEDLVGKLCALRLTTAASQRTVVATVLRASASATRRQGPGRSYRLTLESSAARLRFRRSTRVFQHLSARAIVEQVFQAAGFDASLLEFQLQRPLPELEYLTQYAETDEAFVRRVCASAGVYFHSSESQGQERLVFVDDSTRIPSDPTPLVIVHDSQLNVGGELAWDLRYRRQRCPGKLELRDYDPAQPPLKLVASATGGQPAERSVEVYAAPGGFRSPADGKARAERELARRRAPSVRLYFKSNSVRLRPGLRVRLEASGDVTGAAAGLAGEYLLVAVRHAPDAATGRYRVDVEACPAALPFLLEPPDPPRVFGVHTAVVTGAPGEEIHPHDSGAVFVRFAWDRTGPTDHRSSRPVRVAQPNTPGSMVIPRVGWEVLVAFEDGDPDRPYVLGRLYNAAQPPPFLLPANKTVSAWRSFSSPGGARMNSIHFDDAKGRQHLAIHAGFDKQVTVERHLKTQTAAQEIKTVKGNQTEQIGVNEKVSIKQKYVVSAASQEATVVGKQEISVKGDFTVGVGSEKVLVGGALLEKVGNPVQGLTNLGVAAAMAGASALGGRAAGGLAQRLGGPIAGLAGGQLGGMLAGVAGSAALGAATGQPQAPLLSQLGGHLAGMIPGGGVVMAAVTGMNPHKPWEPAPPAAGAVASGGGAGAAVTDQSKPGTPGPGHRSERVNGAYTEVIGGASAVNTPGRIGWQTLGAAVVNVGGSNVVQARSYSEQVLGASIEKNGSYHIKTEGAVSRSVRGGITTQVSGALTLKADGKYTCESENALQISVGGKLELSGAHVTFRCKDSIVSVSPGGVLVKASNIEIKGATEQSGSSKH